MTDDGSDDWPGTWPADRPGDGTVALAGDRPDGAAWRGARRSGPALGGASPPHAPAERGEEAREDEAPEDWLPLVPSCPRPDRREASQVDDTRVRAAFIAARARWSAAELAWNRATFAVLRAPGLALDRAGRLRLAWFAGVAALDMPSVALVYERCGAVVVLHEAHFEDGA